jgi:hypothetical protein
MSKKAVLATTMLAMAHAWPLALGGATAGSIMLASSESHAQASQQRPLQSQPVQATARQSTAAAFGVPASTGGGSGGSCSPGCDCEVAQVIQSVQIEYVDGMTAIASDPNYGFSRRGSNYGFLSCLRDLMNSGVSGIFSLPSLGDLMGMIENLICNAAEGLYDTVTQPINDTLQDVSGDIIPSGEIIPGVRMGGFGSNWRIRPGMGRPGEVRTNAQQAQDRAFRSYQRFEDRLQGLGGLADETYGTVSTGLGGIMR